MSGDVDKDQRRPGPPATILLVEDDDNDAFTVRHALQKCGLPHHIAHARDGEEAINYLSGTTPFSDRAVHPLPSLVLLDLKMPRLSGFEVLSWLQTKPELRSIPVIVLTGSIRAQDVQDAKALGAVGYEIKPVDYNDLVSIFKSLDARWLSQDRKPKLEN